MSVTRVALVMVLWMFGVAPVLAEGLSSSVDAAFLAKHKQTSLGLYLTPQDAFEALQVDDGIIFLDVRDPVEISFVGHAAGVDGIVPLRTMTHQPTGNGRGYRMLANRHFVADVGRVMMREGKSKDDPVMIICRSGARSAVGANMLAKAGYTNVWNIVEGFEGDRNRLTRQRTVNGWRNAGLPWTYDLDKRIIWTPSSE
ncbi:rhodanese-like domain-containing protein [Coralliovum pocilloporae]|uniref:rhodanese-like domain-containing protein n=1 Tax=Coralliovum pocilloporae TaxID=3066369 RepID=UPI00330737D8